MKHAKKHNHKKIDPASVEHLLSLGYTIGEVASILDYDRKTLYTRRDRDPDLRAAMERGSREGLRRKKLEEELSKASVDPGTMIEQLLEEIVADFEDIRRALFRQQVTV